MMENVNDNRKLREWLSQKAAFKKIPLNGTFELTPRCNMNCRMCYIRMSETEMCQRGREYTANEWIELGKVCAEQGMLMLLLTGGEPFLRPDFRRIYTELKKLGLVISINSNGTLIDEETVEWLKKDPPAQINITLYGSSNETYARLCGNPKGFDQVSAAVDRLTAAGIYVKINMSFTKSNIDDMEEMLDFALKRGLKPRPVTYMFPPVRSAKEGMPDEEVRFTAEESGEARARIERYIMPKEILEKQRAALKEGLNLLLMEEECDRCADEKMGCKAGKCTFWVTWDGRMTPCGIMSEPVTYPFRDGFGQAWKELVEKTEEFYLPAECKDCKKRFACMVCGAVAMSESGGDTTVKPEYMCRYTESYLKKMAE